MRDFAELKEVQRTLYNAKVGANLLNEQNKVKAVKLFQKANNLPTFEEALKKYDRAQKKIKEYSESNFSDFDQDIKDWIKQDRGQGFQCDLEDVKKVRELRTANKVQSFREKNSCSQKQALHKLIMAGEI